MCHHLRSFKMSLGKVYIVCQIDIETRLTDEGLDGPKWNALPQWQSWNQSCGLLGNTVTVHGQFQTLSEVHFTARNTSWNLLRPALSFSTSLLLNILSQQITSGIAKAPGFEHFPFLNMREEWAKLAARESPNQHFLVSLGCATTGESKSCFVWNHIYRKQNHV